MNLEYSDIDKGIVIVVDKKSEEFDGFIYKCRHKDMYYAVYLPRFYVSDLNCVDAAIESINETLKEDHIEKNDLMRFDSKEKAWIN